MWLYLWLNVLSQLLCLPYILNWKLVLPTISRKKECMRDHTKACLFVGDPLLCLALVFLIWSECMERQQLHLQSCRGEGAELLNPKTQQCYAGAKWGSTQKLHMSCKQVRPLLYPIPSFPWQSLVPKWFFSSYSDLWFCSKLHPSLPVFHLVCSLVSLSLLCPFGLIHAD